MTSMQIEADGRTFTVCANCQHVQDYHTMPGFTGRCFAPGGCGCGGPTIAGSWLTPAGVEWTILAPSLYEPRPYRSVTGRRLAGILNAYDQRRREDAAAGEETPGVELDDITRINNELNFRADMNLGDHR